MNSDKNLMQKSTATSAVFTLILCLFGVLTEVLSWRAGISPVLIVPELLSYSALFCYAIFGFRLKNGIYLRYVLLFCALCLIPEALFLSTGNTVAVRTAYALTVCAVLGAFAAGSLDRFRVCVTCLILVFLVLLFTGLMTTNLAAESSVGVFVRFRSYSPAILWISLFMACLMQFLRSTEE